MKKITKPTQKRNEFRIRRRPSNFGYEISILSGTQEYVLYITEEQIKELFLSQIQKVGK